MKQLQRCKKVYGYVFLSQMVYSGALLFLVALWVAMKYVIQRVCTLIFVWCLLMGKLVGKIQSAFMHDIV